MDSNSRHLWYRLLAGIVLLTSLGLALASCGSPATTNTNSPLLVWTDSTRLPGFQLYQKQHPDVKLHIVTLDQTTYLSKLLLLNRTKSGWPDVVFDSGPNDVASLSDAQYQFTADLTPLIPKSTLAQFAANSLAGCQIGGKLYCLRNDLAQNVLWYNAKLMQQFGYTVPTTWEEYLAIGLRVAKEHPGYVIGNMGDSQALETFFWPSRCPVEQLTNADTVKINLSSPNCTRVANLLDPLISNGTVVKLDPFGDDYSKLGVQDKILMMPAASWYGEYVFKPTYKTPKGELAAALPLRWADESSTWTGAQGGGVYYVSAHSSNPQGAANVITWMTTNDAYQATAPTFPAYLPAADAWAKTLKSDPFYATNPYPVLKQAASMIEPNWAYVRYDTDGPFTSVVVAAVQHQQTVLSALSAYQTQLIQLAKIAGYTVVS